MIVIPMAGLSSRFFNCGYKKPKYMLKLKNKSLFEISVESFSLYFEDELFVFIIRDVFNTFDFVDDKIKSMGILNYNIVVLKEETRGQAETVFLGLDEYKHDGGNLFIFNIDTFRSDFSMPDLDSMEDGYLEVFKGSGSNWSFVRPVSNNSTLIDLSSEKNPISNFCCTGLYYFSSIYDFYEAYNYYVNLDKESWERGELYVAPLYNYLIEMGKRIHYHLISPEEVEFCGVPEEYEGMRMALNG